MAVDKKEPGDAGKELRMLALTATAARLGFVPEEEYPKVYGVLMDWNLGDQTASILAMKDGTASLYTTSSFGIIGGQGHTTVRRAAQECARIAGQYYGKGRPVSEYPYPGQGTVNFYMLTHEGVRLCTGSEEAIEQGSDETTPLFTAAQDVLTALRVATEPGMPEDAGQ